MDIKFCSKCENILFILSNENKDLFLGCKVCGNVEDYDGEKCIYSNEFTFDQSETINSNKYLTFDNTLPFIENNKNLKCPNEDCDSNTKDEKSSNISYVKYDETNMKYLYICRYCGVKWKNK